MRKTLVVLLALALVVAALVAPAAAGKKKKKKPKKIERTVTGTYDLPALVVAGTCSQSGAIGCVSFATGQGEEWITELTITDQHGLPVYASIQQDSDGDQIDDVTVADVCGELEEPAQFAPGEVHVWILTPPTSPTCPGQGTSGSVDITFSNMP